MPVTLSDEELLAIPEANLLPGELTYAFQARAIHLAKLQEEQQGITERLQLARHRDDDAEKEDEQRELHDRETILLQRIHEQEEVIRQEAEELDRRTLKLADGRKVYVDGDVYRDEQGRELEGGDRAQAEQQHLEQPQAATWQEKQNIDRQLQQEKAIQRKVEDLQAGKGPEDEAKALNGYEREFQSKVDAGKDGLQKVPDYGSGDYMAELSGLASDFKQATNPQALDKVPDAIPQRQSLSKIDIPGA